MTDRTQFEAMLEALINEDQETAKEIFHNIVVAKSREIYEELLSEDFDVREEREEEEEEEGVDEAFGDEEDTDAEDDAEGDDADADDEGDEGDVGGDATDDFIGDVEDEVEGEEEADGELEDRVLDLEDALDELKAEFEELLSQEAEEEGHDMAAIDAADGEEGNDEFGGDEFGGEEDELAGLMEYVNKVNPPKHGDNGANAKSVVAGKNDMGGTTANIAKGGESKTGGTQGGLANPSTKEDNAGNVNVPGNSKAPKLNTVAAGHGAEKKGKGETADNKRSIVGGK